MSNLKLPPYQRAQRRSYTGISSSSAVDSKLSPASTFTSCFQLIVSTPTISLNNIPMASCDKIPTGYTMMNHQVAGHIFQVGTDQIGMLKSDEDDSVLKPGGSPMCAAREIKFYEQLETTTDPNLQALKEFTSEFRGTKVLNVGNKTVRFIKLKDLTHDMREPCIIDLKMGRRTWDPMATEEKKQTEDGKYVNCKQSVGFCIPGFQTFHLASGNYKKFGKEYGKKLDENSIVEALKLFLNADSGLNRQLITSILTTLWAIQKWMQSQKTFQFYSSSILIVYDARKLRQVLDAQKRKSSSLSLEVKSASLSPSSEDLSNGDSDSVKSAPISVYKKLQRTHSSNNNYDQEMRDIKTNYQQMLDNLVGTYDENKEWIHVKMIDFAHTFNNSELSEKQATGLDSNYLHAIDNLVKIFESLLKSCET